MFILLLKMNKDQSLKANDQKLVLLMAGNDDTGKKSIVKQWCRNNPDVVEENKTFYKSYSFLQILDFIDESPITLPIEIRILNGK
jgi:hypothetical protein